MKRMAWTVGLVMLGALAVEAQKAGETSKAAESPKPVEAPAVYPAAIFAFEERGSGVREYGQKVSDILFANLAVNPDLYLVDRQDIQKTLQEQELNISGMVSPDQAVRIGNLVGARVLITGSILEVDKTVYLIAKIIGTETGRVFGESVKGKTSDEIAPLAEKLAGQVAASITKNAPSLVARTPRTEDRIAALNKALGAAARPSVMVKIVERHVGQMTIDPAAETEMTLFCKETGFEVMDPKASEKKADVLITGEGFSEFAMRRGNLVCVKARVEIKAVDRLTDKLLATDRQTVVVVDLAEQVAGKSALQAAAAQIAERMLPRLVKP